MQKWAAKGHATQVGSCWMALSMRCGCRLCSSGAVGYVHCVVHEHTDYNVDTHLYHARPLLTGMATQGRLHVGVVEEWTNTATGADTPTLTHQNS